MGPKVDTAVADGDDKNSNVLRGFTARETKLLAAAFVSQIGVDKYDYDLMAQLTGNTAGSLKKLLPPVKAKAAELHPSFAAYMGLAKDGDGGKVKSTPKKTRQNVKASESEDAAANDKEEPKKAAGRKRKTPATKDTDDLAAEVDNVDLAESPVKKAKKAATINKSEPKKRGRPKKDTTAIKEEEVDEDNDMDVDDKDANEKDANVKEWSPLSPLSETENIDSQGKRQITDDTFEPGSEEWINANVLNFSKLGDKSIFKH